MRAWARQTNQPDVEERAPATRSFWKGVVQSRVAEQAGTVLALARQHEKALRDYGLTDKLLQLLENRIQTFEPMAIAPLGEKTRRKTVTSTIEEEIAGLSELMDNVLDPLMLQFEESRPKFVVDYENARVQVRRATTPIETIRERAAERAAAVQARREAKAERVAAKAVAKAEAKAQRQSRLDAIANSRTANGTGSNGSGTAVNRRETTVSAEPSATVLSN